RRGTERRASHRCGAACCPGAPDDDNGKTVLPSARLKITSTLGAGSGHAGESGMIDLHAHLLPGVDDGPDTWDEAIAMVRMAAEEGITAMAATSHMMPTGAYANTREQL